MTHHRKLNHNLNKVHNSKSLSRKTILSGACLRKGPTQTTENGRRYCLGLHHSFLGPPFKGRPSFEIEILGRPSLGRPLNQKKHNFLGYVYAFLMLLQHTFCLMSCFKNRFLGLNCGLAGRVHGESHCNYSRHELYLPRAGKVKMLTLDPQTAATGCVGVPRWHAVGIFNIY